MTNQPKSLQIGTRKQQRKEKRNAKKQRKCDHFNQYRSKIYSTIHLETIEPAKKKIKTDLPTKQDVSLKKDVPIKKETPVKKVSLIKNDKLALETTSIEDEEIERMEKKLKIKKDQKLPKEFRRDGLDFLLDGIENGFASSDEVESKEFSDESYGSEEEIDNTLSEDSMEEQSDDLSEQLSEDSGSESNNENLNEDSNYSNANSSDFEEDSTENLKDSDKDSCSTTIDDKKTTSAYVPPGKRASSQDSLSLVKKTIQGALNRLSETNIESIFNQIHSQATLFPRNQIYSSLSETICSFLNDNSSLLESFIYSSACLTSLHYSVYGTDFFGHILESLWKHFTTHLITPSNPEDNEKGILNFVSYFTYLYLFESLSYQFIYSLIHHILSLDHLTFESKLQSILKILKICAYKLRSDNLEKFKQIFCKIDDLEKDTSSKVQFMMEVINDYKVNKKSVIKPFDSSSPVPLLKKFIQSLLKKQGNLTPSHPLQITIEDLNCSEQKGKWWIIGGVWKQPEQKEKGELEEEEEVQDDLIQKAASLHHMNTTIRKAIFEALMRSQDQTDAFHRIISIGLKGVQEREIARVLVHCLAKEKHYNPFYSMVASNLCSHSYSNCITFRFILWDFFNETLAKSTTKPNAILNHAKFFASLILQGALSLQPVIKGISFAKLGKNKILFLQAFLSGLAIEVDKLMGMVESTISEKNGKLQSTVGIEGLLFVMDNFVLNSTDNPFFSVEHSAKFNSLRQFFTTTFK